MAPRDALLAIYAQASTYDTHYSTVRTGASTFLVGLGFGLGAFFLKEQEPSAGFVLALSVPAVIFLFTILLSLHFQRLTWCCRQVEIEIEEALAKPDPGTVYPNGNFPFRCRLKELFDGQSRWHFDGPGTLLVLGIVTYCVVALNLDPRSGFEGLLFLAATVVGAGALAWFFTLAWNWLYSLESKEPAAGRTAAARKRRRPVNALAQLVILILLAAVPVAVVRVARTVSESDGPDAALRAALAEQAHQGPLGGFDPVLVQGTVALQKACSACHVLPLRPARNWPVLSAETDGKP